MVLISLNHSLCAGISLCWESGVKCLVHMREDDEDENDRFSRGKREVENLRRPEGEEEFKRQDSGEGGRKRSSSSKRQKEELMRRNTRWRRWMRRKGGASGEVRITKATVCASLVTVVLSSETDCNFKSQRNRGTLETRITNIIHAWLGLTIYVRQINGEIETFRVYGEISVNKVLLKV